MLNQLFRATSVPLLEQVACFTQARHNVLAGNVANVDTPGYKTRDLSPEMFQARLRSALEARDRAAPESLTGAYREHRGDPVEQVRDELNSLLLHDETNVSIEHQLAEMVKNQLLHQTALTIMTDQFKLMHSAISENP